MNDLTRNIIINVAAAVVVTIATHYAIKPLKESKLLETQNQKK